MDPVSILTIINDSISLAIKCGCITKDIYDLPDKYKRAKLILSAMIQEINTIGAAWRRIGEWLEECAAESNSDELLRQLSESLEGGSRVISALLDDLRQF